VAPQSWFENDTQGVRETWRTLGITGTGVTVAVLDSGVDFGNPALAGRYAVQPTTSAGSQAYAGWPVAYDDRSLSEYMAEPGRAWPGNWGWYVNAGYAIAGSGVYTFADPLAPTYVYTVPGTSLSGRYLLGYHPDPALGDSPLLVADEAVGGVYDAVYVDLDFDGAFETRLSREAPVGALDLSGDGVPDLSAGMLYWIADGAHPPPGAEAVYGSGVPVPAAGTLLAFMIDTPWEVGGGHGTLCASNVVGDDGGAFHPGVRGVAPFYSDTYGSLVQGPAPGARVVAMGNLYAGGSMESWYAFLSAGYDGVAGSGDEPQIVSVSFGEPGVDNDGWDWESRHVTRLGLTHGDDAPSLWSAPATAAMAMARCSRPTRPPRSRSASRPSMEPCRWASRRRSACRRGSTMEILPAPLPVGPAPTGRGRWTWWPTEWPARGRFLSTPWATAGRRTSTGA